MLRFLNGGAGDEQSPSISFYNRLRDDVAGRLITKFGRDAQLIQFTSSYDPNTGTSTNTETEYNIKLVILPVSSISSGMPQGSTKYKTISNCDIGVLISAEETFTDEVIPKRGDILKINSERLTIVEITSVSPGGTDVIFKAGASYG